jgi:hypothetical protein
VKDKNNLIDLTMKKTDKGQKGKTTLSNKMHNLRDIHIFYITLGKDIALLKS